MGFAITDLGLEVTRRCNESCKHCMRGQAQPVDLTKEMVDELFAKNKIESVTNLLFSGGEPLENAEIIIYIIDKIISENIDVCKISMITNGKKYSEALVDALNRFNEYRNKRAYARADAIRDKIKDIDKWLEYELDQNVVLAFSTDKYHEEINLEIIKKYSEQSKGLVLGRHAVDESEIIRTGNATFGRRYSYYIGSVDYCLVHGDEEKQQYLIMNSIYLTATGYITNNFDGQYTDMDKTNFGHLTSTNLAEILYKYGTPHYSTPRITEEDVVQYKKTLKS